jgi:hypothetical protein
VLTARHYGRNRMACMTRVSESKSPSGAHGATVGGIGLRSIVVAAATGHDGSVSVPLR